MILDVKNVKRKKKIEEMIQSQKGPLNKFFIKESQASFDNQHDDVILDVIQVDKSNEILI